MGIRGKNMIDRGPRGTRGCAGEPRGDRELSRWWRAGKGPEWNEERRIGGREKRGDENAGGKSGWMALFPGDDEGSYSAAGRDGMEPFFLARVLKMPLGLGVVTD